MSTLLHLDSSGKGSISVTRPLTHYFAEKWQHNNAGGKVIYRDLLESALPFVNEEMVGAYYTPADKQTAQQKQTLALSDALIEELKAADTYIFGVPMYNFTVPAVFKAYIDQVVRAGKTFSYEGGTPSGLLLNKRLIVITSSGADYSSPPMKSLDFVEPYLRGIFGFLGVTNLTVISAPGRDEATIAAAKAKAQKQMDELLHTAAVR